MIIRLDQSFIETLSQLGEIFSGNDRQRLADASIPYMKT